MRVLFVGPDLLPPWTEGRKNFVRDLAPCLKAHVAVRLLTVDTDARRIDDPCDGVAVAARGKLRALPALERGLERELAQWHPDVVCHFPYGTFHGLRGWANTWCMRRVDRRCARHATRCLTILYSITRASRASLREQVRELVLSPAPEWSGSTLTLGTNLNKAMQIRSGSSGKPTLLFMAGTADERPGVLPYLLEERGLADLVQVAPALTEMGMRVTVAVPALRHLGIRQELERRFRAAAPGLDLDLRAAVAVPEIFADTDFYVFPYRIELEQFVPTSILEAMAAGVPVVLSDLRMLAGLANGGRTAYVYPRGNGRALAELLRQARRDETGRRERAAAARAYVLTEWSIERSATELLRLLGEGGAGHRDARETPEKEFGR